LKPVHLAVAGLFSWVYDGEVMKSYTLKFRQEDRDNFDEVRRGVKPIETRAATVRYQPIEVGDTLVFVCGEERFEKKVIKRYHWPSVDAMVAEIPFKHVMPDVGSVEEMKKAYSSYPDYDKKIAEFGLLGFELE
jgi:ASC-1-like (ASCH) protein